MFTTSLRPLHTSMRPVLWLLLLWLGFAPLFAAMTADPHTFVNESGASFSGQILSVVGDEVTIKREDGQSFRPKIAVFSKADQKYIRDWVIKSATAHDGSALAIHAAITKGVINPYLSPGRGVSSTTWTEKYQITIKNLVSANFSSLRVSYVIFKLSAKPDALPPKDFIPLRFSGSQPLEKLSGNEEKSLALEKIDMLGYSLDPNYVWPNNPSAPRAISDKLRGIWIRVYDQDNNMLQEWASDPDIAKTESWTPPPPLPAKGATAGKSTAQGK